MSVVSVEIGSKIEFHAIVIDTPESANYLQKDQEVIVLFKETEVIITTDKTPNISIENQIAGIIINIEKGSLLSELTIQVANHQLSAILTSKSVEALNLRTGSEIIAMIKINDVMLSD